MSLNDLPDDPEPNFEAFEQAEHELLERLSTQDDDEQAILEQILKNTERAEQDLMDMLDETDLDLPDEGEK